MAVTTVTDLNSLYNNIYERAVLAARALNLMANLVDNRSASGWMTRTTTIRPQVTAASVAEAQDFSAPTTFGKSSLATFTPGEVIAQAVLTDRDMETDPDSAQQQAVEELGAAIATKIDSDLCSAFTSFTTDKGNGASQTFTFAKFAAGISVLGNNNARQYGGLNAVLHPYHWHDLWLELGKPAATYPNLSDVTVQALRDYFVGTLLGNVAIYTTANIPLSGSDAVSAAFAPPALLLDTRRPARMEVQRDASLRATELNMTAGYAYGVNRNAFGIKYTADATEPA
jgi:hypothetical protein